MTLTFSLPLQVPCHSIYLSVRCVCSQFQWFLCLCKHFNESHLKNGRRTVEKNKIKTNKTDLKCAAVFYWFSNATGCLVNDRALFSRFLFSFIWRRFLFHIYTLHKSCSGDICKRLHLNTISVHYTLRQTRTQKYTYQTKVVCTISVYCCNTVLLQPILNYCTHFYSIHSFIHFSFQFWPITWILWGLIRFS